MLIFDICNAMTGLLWDNLDMFIVLILLTWDEGEGKAIGLDAGYKR